MLVRSVIVLRVVAIYSIGVLGKAPGYFDIGPKIINGSIALAEGNKYQVSIRLKEREFFFGSGHICGGALIKPSMVITAAHCIYNFDFKTMRAPNEFEVSMGSMNRYDRVNSTVFEILDIYYKETFNSSTFVDDIAIMIMNGLVPRNLNNIKPIDINWDVIPDGTMCQISGWGATRNENGPPSDVLMKVDVPIFNETLCKEQYNGSVSEGMICAGYTNGMADACNGDSGGPLACNGKLTGIISFGVGCAVENFTGVYTDLNYHSKWIKNITDRFENRQNSAITEASVSVFLNLFLGLIVKATASLMLN